MSETTRVVCVDPAGVLGGFAEALVTADEPFSVQVVEDPADLEDCRGDCVVVPHVPPSDDGRQAIDGVDLLSAVQSITDLPAVLYGPGPLDTDAVGAALTGGAADAVFTPPKRQALLARRIRRAAGHGGTFPDAEVLLSEILDLVESDLFIKDDLGRLAAASSNIAADHGYDPGQLEGLTDYELFEEELADRLWQEEQEMLADPDRSIERIDHWVDDGGRDRWHTARKWPRTDGRETTGLVGDAREVTELVRRERVVSHLHRSMQDLLTARSADAVARAVADLPETVPSFPATRVAFFERGSVTVQSPDEPTPIDLDRFESWFARVARSGKAEYLTDRRGSLTPIEVPLRGFDFDPMGDSWTEIDVEAAFLPLGDHGSFGVVASAGTIEPFSLEIAAVIASNVEAVLDRVERERELREREQRLSVLERVLRHNLRNDMNSMLANLQRIADESTDTDVTALAASASETGWDLVETSGQARTIEGVLDASDRLTVRDLASIVDSVVDDVADAVPDATFDLDLPGTAYVRAIPTLEIAVENVVENAVEHNDGSAPWVGITVERDGEAVVLSVTDDGPGIPEAERAVTEGSLATDLEHSSGLGLWLVYWLVENSHGEIEVETTSRGSRVVIRLPGIDDRYRAESDEDPERHP